MISRVPLTALLLLSFLFPVIAQQPVASPQPKTTGTQQPNPPDSQDVVRITTNLVQVDAVVTKDGKAITDLQPEDFEILQDGKPQSITNFSYISNVRSGATPIVAIPAKSKDKSPLPIPPAKINASDQRRIVALVIDDLGISWESMTQIRAQVRKFIDQASPDDLIAIIRTGADVGALQQFTNDKRLLQSAWDRLRWNPCSRAGFYVFTPIGSTAALSPGLCYMTSTLKSLTAIVKGMRYLPGRKSMILFSDNLPVQRQEGQDFSQGASLNADWQTISDLPGLPSSGFSYETQMQRVAELAIRASVVIYGVDSRGLQPTGLTAADDVAFLVRSGVRQSNVLSTVAGGRSNVLWNNRQGLHLMSNQTGGYLVRNSNDFGLKEIMNDQQGYYLIGFRPAERTFNRNFHHIKVRVKRNGLTVRTRAGFYGFTDEEARPKQLTVADEMNKAIISPFSTQDITVRLTSIFVDDPKQGPIIRSLIYLDPHDLSFSEADGWHSTNLAVKSVVFGDNGGIIAQDDRIGRLRFRDEGYERATREGVTYSFDLPLKARGAFQFRVAVRDRNTAKIGSAGQFVEMPDLRKGRLAISGIIARATVAGTAENPDAVVTSQALRQFRPGSTISFVYQVYNPNVSGKASQLTAQMRIVRDGKIVFDGEAVPLDLTGQNDPQRPINIMKLELRSQFEPGNYVCQIIVTDTANKEPRVVSQWIDFEVIK